MVVRTVTLDEAMADLDRLVGEEFIIVRDGRPVARVVPIRHDETLPRIGFMPDIEVPDDFDDLGSGVIPTTFAG